MQSLKTKLDTAQKHAGATVEPVCHLNWSGFAFQVNTWKVRVNPEPKT